MGSWTRRYLERSVSLMYKLRVHSFSISIDGYGAGPNQDLPESARSWEDGLSLILFDNESDPEPSPVNVCEGSKVRAIHNSPIVSRIEMAPSKTKFRTHTEAKAFLQYAHLQRRESGEVNRFASVVEDTSTRV